MKRVRQLTKKGFVDEFAFLSNFYLSSFVLDGELYRSVEHYYQACKCEDPVVHEEIRSCLSPADAKRKGRKCRLTADWESRKLEVMERALFAKFGQNIALKEVLLATEGIDLIEMNWWGDVFWGVCKGKGQNHLGRLLMKVRTHYLENPGKIH